MPSDYYRQILLGKGDWDKQKSALNFREVQLNLEFE